MISGRQVASLCCVFTDLEVSRVHFKFKMGSDQGQGLWSRAMAGASVDLRLDPGAFLTKQLFKQNTLTFPN
eukprot:5480553-Heterocapsa_arctica.AAC.1